MKIKKAFIKIIEKNRELKEIKKRFEELDIPIDLSNLSNFGFEMQKVIDKKKEKHKDTWKDTNLNDLRDLMEEKTFEWRSNREVLHYEREERLLIHIANYCYFLYSRLMEIKKE